MLFLSLVYLEYGFRETQNRMYHQAQMLAWYDCDSVAAVRVRSLIAFRWFTKRSSSCEDLKSAVKSKHNCSKLTRIHLSNIYFQ